MGYFLRYPHGIFEFHGFTLVEELVSVFEENFKEETAKDVSLKEEEIGQKYAIVLCTDKLKQEIDEKINAGFIEQLQKITWVMLVEDEILAEYVHYPRVEKFQPMSSLLSSLIQELNESPQKTEMVKCNQAKLIVLFPYLFPGATKRLLENTAKIIGEGKRTLYINGMSSFYGTTSRKDEERKNLSDLLFFVMLEQKKGKEKQEKVMLNTLTFSKYIITNKDLDLILPVTHPIHLQEANANVLVPLLEMAKKQLPYDYLILSLDTYFEGMDKVIQEGDQIFGVYRKGERGSYLDHSSERLGDYLGRRGEEINILWITEKLEQLAEAEEQEELAFLLAPYIRDQLENLIKEKMDGKDERANLSKSKG